MILPGHNYTPKFIFKKKYGPFPYELFLGFETELSIWKNNAGFIDNTINNLIKDTNNFFYIKYDGSISGGESGAEINSHPFNWNFILENKNFISKLSSIKEIRGDGKIEFDFSRAKQFRINRTCGFHIHVSRNFFSKEQILSLVDFFYHNREFIEKISLREDTNGLKNYAKTYIKEGTAEEFVKKSTEFCLNRDYRYMALNLTSNKTFEIRIFQGTLNEDTIWAYLEFALGVSLFVKNYKRKDMQFVKFLNYIYKNKRTYRNFIKLHNGELKWD